MREFDLLKRIHGACGGPSGHVVIPPGDDLAMLGLEAEFVLTGVDQLVAGTHFDPQTTPVDLVGRKAVTRCLSDIAAMAARPVACLAAVTLPPDYGERRAHELFDAVRETAEQYRCPLVGGDIAFHREPQHPLVCAVTCLAVPGPRRPAQRGDAMVGDTVYVTGALGDNISRDGAGRHLTFNPRIDAALALAEQLGDRLHAMIDLSDGLGRDAGHIAEQSHVQIVLDAARLPCRNTVPWREALAQGEDYELCFTATGDVPNTVAVTEGDLSITAVGTVQPWTSHAERVMINDHNQLYPVEKLGWEHHSQ